MASRLAGALAVTRKQHGHHRGQDAGRDGAAGGAQLVQRRKIAEGPRQREGGPALVLGLPQRRGAGGGLYCTILHYTLLYYIDTMLCRMILYCSVLYYSILFDALLFHFMLYFIILYCVFRSGAAYPDKWLSQNFGGMCQEIAAGPRFK